MVRALLTLPVLALLVTTNEAGETKFA